MGTEALITASNPHMEARIGVLITAKDYVELQRVFEESPGLADILLVPSEQLDECLRIEVAGKPILVLRVLHARLTAVERS